jgi:ribose 1,5-bisphosphokinase PhnN
MGQVPPMYKKLENLAHTLAERDRESDEEIARRLRFTKQEVRKALGELKRGIW